MLKKLNSYFTLTEKILWIVSVLGVVVSFIAFASKDYVTLASSLIGVTSLIFCAKGNPIGPFLMIVFSLFYGYVSYTFSYYGEVATYVGMTLPMSVISLVSWLKNPYGSNKSEVKVAKLSVKSIIAMIVLSAVVTAVFYFILVKFNTANIIPSTISVTTSFVAVFLTYKRSPYYAVAYACNDVILIILWTLAFFEDSSYISVVVCFIAFLANDIYGFVNWKKMHLRQLADSLEDI